MLSHLGWCRTAAGLFVSTLFVAQACPAQTNWTHVSSARNELPKPTGSIQQTACVTADFNLDGKADFIVASRLSNGSIDVWLSRTSGWHQRFPVWTSDVAPEAGGATHDIDGDGDPDLVLGQDYSGDKMFWWENPHPNFGAAWKMRTIKTGGGTQHHDQLFGDFDGDGAVELVSWNQGAGHLLMLDIPATPRTAGLWTKRIIGRGSYGYEGLAAADIDGDGAVDIVGAGRWWRHTGSGRFTEFVIDATVRFARTAVGQLLPGGRPEVVLIPGDANGDGYWYDWDGQRWRRHHLRYFYHGHTLDVADLDGDGNLDIFTGEMKLGRAQCELSVYYGDAKGNFQREVLAVGNGVHDGRLADVDGDGDQDIVHKPYNDAAPRIEIWRNDRPRLRLDRWRRHAIDAAMPHNAVFIVPGDLDGDGKIDAVAGGHWYRNSGGSTPWTRRAVGSVFQNVAIVSDFDGDGDLDLFGTRGRGATPNAEFAWAENDGRGNFTVRTNIPSGTGDFLQGAVATRGAGGPLQIALSWHAAGNGIQVVTVPSDPRTQQWSWRRVSSTSQDEDLSSGDVDGDGDRDLLLGTEWLSAPSQQRNVLGRVSDLPGIGGTPTPDRNELVDIDGDGDLDVVVSLERGREILWFENPRPQAPPTGTWRRHILGRADGQGFSLDVADFDRDGDMDVVLGEHRGPSVNRVLIFENQVASHGRHTMWAEHVVDSQPAAVIDHHDGTRVVDVDGDGDLDIVSIGWTHRKAWWFENLAIDQRQQVDRPVVTPDGGPFRAYRMVTMATATPGADLHYTLDGSVPTTSSPRYTQALRIAATTEVQVRAFHASLDASEIVRVPFLRATGEAGFWRFDQGAGTVAHDDARNGHNGRLRGATWSKDGHVQGCLAFDGRSSGVDLGAVDFSGDALTLSAWIYPEQLKHLPAHDARILSKATGVAEQEHILMLSTVNGGSATRLRFRLRTSGRTSTLIAGLGDLPIGAWAHVAAVYDGKAMLLYLNGVEVGRTTKSGRIDDDPTAAAWIGNQPPSADRPFDGRIDELRWFRRALTPVELRALAHERAFDGTLSFGRSTAYCGESMRFDVSRAPVAGDPNFSIGAADLPRNAPGIFVAGHGATGGVPIQNTTLYIDLNRWFLAVYVRSDATGRVAIPMSLATATSGASLYFQFLFANTQMQGCPPAIGYSATDAMRVTAR